MTRINKMGYLIKKEKYFFYYKSNNGEVNVLSSPIYLKMNESQPVRRVAHLHRECRLSYRTQVIVVRAQLYVLFANVLWKRISTLF